MRFFLVATVLTGYVVCFLNCTGESIGRNIDPDYDTYLKNRTSEQKMKDDKDKENVQTKQNSNSGKPKFEKELDAKFDAMAREQRQKDQGN
jgi:hypothetical protein